MTPTVYPYQLSRSEWFQAILASAKRRPLVAFTLAFSMLWIAMCLFMLAAQLSILIRGTQPRWQALLGMLFLITFGTFYLWFISFQLRRETEVLPFQRANVEMALSYDEEIFSIAIPNHSEFRYHWRALHHYAETKRIGLVYLSKKQFVAIPKRAIPEQARQVISSKIEQGKVRG